MAFSLGSWVTDGLQWRLAAMALFCLWLAMPVDANSQVQVIALRTVQQSSAALKYSRQNEERPGLCMEILRAVESLDRGLRFEGLQTDAPLRRVEAMLRSGEVDIFFCLLRTYERQLDWDYLPVPLYEVRHVVVQRKGDSRPMNAYRDLQALARTNPVAVTRGTSLSKSLRAQGIPIQEVMGDQEALAMLLKGRTEAVYGQDANILHVIEETGLRNHVQVSAATFGVEHQYVAVSRQLPRSARERILVALETLQRTGVLAAISRKYLDAETALQPH